MSGTQNKENHNSHKSRSLLSQFISFTGIGAIATGLQYTILITLIELELMGPVFASASGFLISAVFNYYMNYHFTFKSEEQHASAAVKFGTVASIGLIWNTLIMYTMVHILNIDYLASQVTATLAVLVWNFLANRQWTFRASKPKEV